MSREKYTNLLKKKYTFLRKKETFLRKIHELLTREKLFTINTDFHHITLFLKNKLSFLANSKYQKFPTYLYFNIEKNKKFDKYVLKTIISFGYFLQTTSEIKTRFRILNTYFGLENK